jgi:glutathione peroxidase
MLLKLAFGLIVVLVVGGVGAAYALGFIFNPSPSEPPNVASVYDFKMKNIDGSEVKLETYKGKVVMIVNTASKCGLTPQYEALQATYDKYKDIDFVVLGFPSNNFMGQEPGTDNEIKEFCTLKYKVSFPMFSKISVKGTDQHPLYTYLTNEKSNPGFSGDISWNFEKFLIGKDGKTLARFSPSTKPDDAKIIEAIEKALK